MKTKSCGPWLCQPAPQACASSPPRTIQEFWSLEAQIITTMWVSRNKHHSSNLVRVQSLYQPQFFCCFIILYNICLILSSLTGTDLCPNPISALTLLKILEMLQIWKANVFVGKYGEGKGCKEMARKTGHLGKKYSIFVNITLNILSLLILRWSISHESLLLLPHLSHSLLSQSFFLPDTWKKICICFQDFFIFFSQTLKFLNMF